MVDSKKYNPTITRFQKHTQSFVSGKTKKGHLNNNERENGDVIKEEGILVRVDKNNIYGKGWEVKIDNKTIKCTYGDNIIYLPECSLTGSYYQPKSECKVEVSIDKKSKINTITRIKDPNKKPITMMDDKVTLQGKGESSIVINKKNTVVSGDILVKTSSDNDLPDQISVTDLYKRVEAIESKLSDNNDI